LILAMSAVIWLGTFLRQISCSVASILSIYTD
jgi:hypothetical protein